MAQYEIVITNGTEQSSPVQLVPKAQNSVGGEKDVPVSAGAKYAQSLLKKVVGPGVIVHTVDQVISHNHDMISLTTGQQEYGQRASYAYSKGSSFIKSVVMGGLAGSSFGPVGAIAGAGVAALLNVGSQAMSYFLQSDTISKEKDLEDISIRMRTMRATVSGRRYSNVTEY